LSKEEPSKVLDSIGSYNWTRILQLDQCRREDLFCNLHNLPFNALRMDPGNTKAKEFLQKLGACHELFRSALSRILELRLFKGICLFRLCLSAYFGVLACEFLSVIEGVDRLGRIHFRR
jgi:hypothetical protein